MARRRRVYGLRTLPQHLHRYSQGGARRCPRRQRYSSRSQPGLAVVYPVSCNSRVDKYSVVHFFHSVLWSRASRLRTKVKQACSRLRSSKVLDPARHENVDGNVVMPGHSKPWRVLADLGINATPDLLRAYVSRNPTVDLNLPDAEGNTLLSNSIKAFNDSLSRWLVTCGKVALSSSLQSRSKDPLTVALESGNVSSIELLAQHGAVREAGNNYQFLLHEWCKNTGAQPSRIAALGILLRHGVNVNSAKWDVGTVLDYSIARDDRRLAYMFMLFGARSQMDVTTHDPAHVFSTSKTQFYRDFSTAFIPYLLIRYWLTLPACCEHCVPEVVGRQTHFSDDLLRFPVGGTHSVRNTGTAVFSGNVTQLVLALQDPLAFLQLLIATGVIDTSFSSLTEPVCPDDMPANQKLHIGRSPRLASTCNFTGRVRRVLAKYSSISLKDVSYWCSPT